MPASTSALQAHAISPSATNPRRMRPRAPVINTKDPEASSPRSPPHAPPADSATESAQAPMQGSLRVTFERACKHPPPHPPPLHWSMDPRMNQTSSKSTDFPAPCPLVGGNPPRPPRAGRSGSGPWSTWYVDENVSPTGTDSPHPIRVEYPLGSAQQVASFTFNPPHPPPHAQRAQTTPLPGSASELERRRVCLSFAPSRPMTPRGAEASRACGLACPVPCVCVVCAPSLVGSLLQSGAHACCTCLSRDRPRPRPPGPLRMLAAAVVSSGARRAVEWPGPR